MKRARVLVVLMVLLSCGVSLGGAPWHASLCYDGGGYWPVRVPVTIRNTTGAALDGTAVRVTLRTADGTAALIGQPVASVRVVEANGAEVLFDLTGKDGEPKRAGTLAAGDALALPAEAGAGEDSTNFIYAGNAQAWLPPDWLPSALVNAKLETLQGAASIEARVGTPERRELNVLGAAAPWPSDAAWAWRAPLRVRNFEDEAAPPRRVSFDTRHLRNRMAKILGFGATPGLMVADPGRSNAPVAFSGTLDDEINVATGVPARSEKVLWLYARATPATAPASTPAGTIDNLAINGNMEQGRGSTPMGWASGREGNATNPLWTAQRVRGGVDGDWCLELTVPMAIKEVGWVGWRQKAAVTPGLHYALSAWVKTKGADGDVRVHGHWLKADGSLAANPYFSTPQGVTGDQDWSRLSVMALAPPDAAFLEMHLTMNGHGTVWHDNVTLTEASLGVAGEIEARRPPAAFAAWPVNAQVKMFGEDLPPLTMRREIALGAARNQYEAFQVAVRSPVAARVAVRAGALAGPGGARLAAPAVYHNRRVPVDFNVGYDSSREPAYHRLLSRNRGGDGWPGQWPDPLAPVTDGTVAVQAGVCEALWFDVRVPADAPPGPYTGAVEVGTGGSTIRLPVTLDVWHFTQPAERRCVAMHDMRVGDTATLIPGASVDESRRTWWRFLATYNVSPSYVEPYPEFKVANGTVTMDATAFDREAPLLLDELHCNRVYTPWLFYAAGWAYAPKAFLGVDPKSPEYETVWKTAYKLYIDHVTEKGWRKKIEYYLSDEPSAASRPTIDGLNRLADMAKSVAPDVPIYSSTWAYIQGLEGHLTMWGIGPQGTFPPARIEARRAAGDRFLFTTDGQMCTDTPLLAIERLLPWLALKYDTEGYEFWGVNWWTYDPWQIGWHKFIRQSNDGKAFEWVRYPNGDGFLTYPGGGCGQAGPVASIRLVAAREGVDDYEILRALRTHARAGNREARQALDRVLDLVQIPNAGGRISTSLMADPETFTAARMAAGETLSRLEARGGR